MANVAENKDGLVTQLVCDVLAGRRHKVAVEVQNLKTAVEWGLVDPEEVADVALGIEYALAGVLLKRGGDKNG